MRQARYAALFAIASAVAGVSVQGSGSNGRLGPIEGPVCGKF
ncbi:MAG TPA: hypothetical protein VN224_13945 [Xanthomonadales bacterium]|nr:hypothetical protein [Xanthomonadales bacterium]